MLKLGTGARFFHRRRRRRRRENLSWEGDCKRVPETGRVGEEEEEEEGRGGNTGEGGGEREKEREGIRNGKFFSFSQLG